MDIPNGKKGAHGRDPERARLLRENSYLSSSEINYYGSTPTSLKIPNVNSISDLNEVERAFKNYSSIHDEGAEMPGGLGRKFSHQLSQSLSAKGARNGQLEASTSVGNAMFRMDSEALDASTSLEAGQFSNSIKTTTTRQMNNFVSSGSIRLNSYNGDTNSLYHYMREQRSQPKAQIYESLDYEVNENVLYFMEKRRSLRSRQKNSIFCKYIRSYFPSQKEASRWLTIFLIGTFTALTACFIVVNVEYFTEQKYEYLRNLFNVYLAKNKVMTFNHVDRNSTSASNAAGLLNSTTTLLDIDASSFQTLSVDKSVLWMRLVKLQIPMLFWFLTNAIPTLLGSALVTYLGECFGRYFERLFMALQAHASD